MRKIQKHLKEQKKSNTMIIVNEIKYIYFWLRIQHDGMEEAKQINYITMQ